MKLLHSDLKKGEVKVLTQSMDDLWYLSTIIEPKDIVKGKTLRKIKIGSEESRESAKKAVFMKLEAEKVEFSKTTNILRVLGIIKEAPEDVPLGSHHTFSIDDNTSITIIKGQWLKYQIEKLKEACSEKKSSLLICVHDREEAYFALLKKYGFEILAHIEGDVKKKREESIIAGKMVLFFIKILTKDLLNHMAFYDNIKVFLLSIDIYP